MDERPRAVWRIGNWQVSPDLGEIARDGRSKKLDPRAMRLLMFLAERPGQVVALRELLHGVWGNAVVTPHSVYEAIAALRQALEDSSDTPECIVTLPRRGYRLIAPVEPPSAPGTGRRRKRRTNRHAHGGKAACATTPATHGGRF